jgi:Na+-driven multidrug efflux pump
LDGPKAVASGAMRGLGILKPTVYIVFASYYLISPPFEYLFGYTMGFEVSGLWAGLFLGEAFHFGAMAYLIYWKNDWNVIAREAHERMEREKAN